MPMDLLWLIGEGFLVKSIASFDDTITRIPVITHLTKTYKGRIAFSVGTLLALTAILLIAIFFSGIINLFPYSRQLTAGLIFILAVLLYFDLFLTAESRYESKILSQESSHKLLKITWMGFVVSFITLIDDSFVLLPLFLRDHLSNFYSVIGVYLAALAQIVLVIYFGESLKKIKHKKELAAGSLVLLSILVVTGVV